MSKVTSAKMSIFRDMFGTMLGGGVPSVYTSTTGEMAELELRKFGEMARILFDAPPPIRLKMGFRDRLGGGGNAQVVKEAFKAKAQGVTVAKPATISMTDPQVEQALMRMAQELCPDLRIDEDSVLDPKVWQALKEELLKGWSETLEEINSPLFDGAEQDVTRKNADKLARNISNLEGASNFAEVLGAVTAQCGGSPNNTFRDIMDGHSHREQDGFTGQRSQGATDGLSVVDFADCWDKQEDEHEGVIFQKALLNTDMLKERMVAEINQALTDGCEKLLFAGKETVIGTEKGLQGVSLKQVWQEALVEVLETDKDPEHIKVLEAAQAQKGHLIDDMIAQATVKDSDRKKTRIFAPGIYGPIATKMVKGFLKEDGATSMGPIADNPAILMIRAFKPAEHYNANEVGISHNGKKLVSGGMEFRQKVPAEGGVACCTESSIDEIKAFVHHAFGTAPDDSELVFSLPVNVRWDDEGENWVMVNDEGDDIKEPMTFEERVSQVYLDEINKINKESGGRHAYVMNLEDTARYMHYGQTPQKSGYDYLDPAKKRAIASPNLIGDFWGDTMAQARTTSILRAAEPDRDGQYPICSIELTTGGTNPSHYEQQIMTGVSLHSMVNLISGQQLLLRDSGNAFDAFVADMMDKALAETSRLVPYDKSRFRREDAAPTSMQGFYYEFMAKLIANIKSEETQVAFFKKHSTKEPGINIDRFKVDSTLFSPREGSVERLQRKSDLAHAMATAVFREMGITPEKLNGLERQMDQFRLEEIDTIVDGLELPVEQPKKWTKGNKTVTEPTKAELATKWMTALSKLYDRKTQLGIDDPFELPECMTPKGINAKSLVSIGLGLTESSGEAQTFHLRQVIRGYGYQFKPGAHNPVVPQLAHKAVAILQVTSGYFPYPAAATVGKLGEVSKLDEDQENALMASPEVRELLLEKLEACDNEAETDTVLDKAYQAARKSGDNPEIFLEEMRKAFQSEGGVIVKGRY